MKPTLISVMAKTEAQKAARREQRAIGRKEAEEAREKFEERTTERQGPDPYEDVVCYRCHEKGHYAATCWEKRKKRKVDDSFARP